MNFKTALTTCFKEKYCCFSGRATRAEYGYFALCFFFFYVIASGLMVYFLTIDIHYPLSQETFETSLGQIFFISIIYLPILLPSLGVLVRRLHDLNWSGWFALLLLVPYVGQFFPTTLIFLKGTEGENRFGLAFEDEQ